MSATPVKDESFMPPVILQADAAPWLADAAVLAKKDTAAWVRALRETGAETFAKTGLPTPSWEGWQHMSFRPMINIAFRYAADAVKFDAKKIPAKLLEDSDRLVIVNGQYQPHLSSVPDGVMVMSLIEAVETKLEGLEEHLVSVGDLAATPFRALNTAYLRDGVVVKVKPQAEAARPLEVLFYNIALEGEALAIHPRTLYWLGENSGLTILERHMGEGVYFANHHSTVIQEPASRFKFYRLQEESLTAYHFSFTSLHQQRDSVFENMNYATGGTIVREEYQNQLLDSQVLTTMGGVYLLQGRQNHDFTVLMDHFEQGGTSVQHFRGVIDDQARSVFQGKIHVRGTAQKTNGNQRSHALLLSDQAEARFKPELEIYADDVKCSHGATSGKLDEAALFYMRSRGIPDAEARAILIQAFLNETLEDISNADVKSIYLERIGSWFNQ